MTTNIKQATTLWPWRPLYWEPVSDTGERLMVGVLYNYQHQIKATRTIRNEVLDCLYGKSSQGIKKLLNNSLDVISDAATAASVEELELDSFLGLHLGPLRTTEAYSAAELLQTACYLYSSLSNLDVVDEQEASDSPQPSHVNKQFATEVREIVLSTRSDLSGGFNRTCNLITGGEPVKFGYFSPSAIVHFSVLSSTRQPSSMRDARAKLWELSRAREQSGIDNVALIAATPRADDPDLGSKQREKVHNNLVEMEKEADSVSIRWHSVANATEGASKLVELIA